MSTLYKILSLFNDAKALGSLSPRKILLRFLVRKPLYRIFNSIMNRIR